MVLQYKGFNNNWCYEEANTIIWANVKVDSVLSAFRIGGEKYKQKKIDIDNSENHAREVDLKYSKDMLDFLNKYIIQETHCSDNIIYLIGDKAFTEMTDVCVVSLKDEDKWVTYVLNKDAYLLNKFGNTVQKIN